MPIDRIVSYYRNGEDAQAIQRHYPILTVEQVEQAIEFYLSHKHEVLDLMAKASLAEDEWCRTHPNPPELVEKIERFRRETQSRQKLA